MSQAGGPIVRSDLRISVLFFIFKDFIYYLNYRYVPCVGICAQEFRCPRRPEAGVTGGYETITLLGGLGCWKPNLGPLQEQNSILTSDPSMQTLILIKKKTTLKSRLVLNLQHSCFNL